MHWNYIYWNYNLAKITIHSAWLKIIFFFLNRDLYDINASMFLKSSIEICFTWNVSKVFINVSETCVYLKSDKYGVKLLELVRFILDKNFAIVKRTFLNFLQFSWLHVYNYTDFYKFYHIMPQEIEILSKWEKWRVPLHLYIEIYVGYYRIAFRRESYLYMHVTSECLNLYTVVVMFIR